MFARSVQAPVTLPSLMPKMTRLPQPAYNDPMKSFSAVSSLFLLLLSCASVAVAQKDVDNEPTSYVSFVVVKDANGKPVRNAAVIMHPVDPKGKQGRGGMELKTDAEGKTSFDYVPYGKLRVQVLAHGFQTYGEDYEIDKPKTEFTIKLKEPASQFSVYDGQKSTSTPPKQDAPPPSPNKPN